MSQASPTSPVEEVATFFAQAPSVDEILRFQLSAAAQEHIAMLLDKEDDGVLTEEEKRQLDELLFVNDFVLLIRSRIPRTTA